MKYLCLIIVGILCITLSNIAYAKIKPFDNSNEYAYPYVAAKESIKIIKSNIDSVKPKMTYDDVVNIIGEPDIVDDLNKRFFGLSPKEDGFMLPNRRHLKYRAIWYIKKKTEGINLNDVWLSVYIGNDEVTILKVMTNKIIPGDDSF